ncbi:MAG: hypothetical protein ABJI45_05765 [Paracoccaceae bacterium]
MGSVSSTAPEVGSIFSTAAPEVGSVFTPEALGAIEATIVIIELFGLELARTTALLILAAMLFFFGVALSCFLRLNGKVHWSKVFLSSIVVFCLASPAWAFTLEGNWSQASSMPVLDGVFRWIEGSGPMPRNLFAVGIVILMGMMSWPLMNRVLKYARSKITPPPKTPAATA